MMEELFKTGEFAKKANVTERTLRYYDKIGLLKPMKTEENGYRYYSEKELLKLQKIIILKHLGFSLDEIFPIILEDETSISDSLNFQLDILNQKIQHMQSLKETLVDILSLSTKGNVSWNRIIESIQIANGDLSIIAHYKKEKAMDVRMSIHDDYSTNKIGWFAWLISNIDLKNVNSLLEIGSGNGRIWEEINIDLRNRDFFLSDINESTVKSLRLKFGRNFNCMVINCEEIPFNNCYFDALLANHVLFELQDLRKGLSEVKRILQDGGMFYCATYGNEHMKEIEQLAKVFNSKIHLSEEENYKKFGIENGENILKRYFTDVKFVRYSDSLEVDDASILIEYILSCGGNQNEIIGKDYNVFKSFVEDYIKKVGHFHITKDVGLFICKK